MKPVTILAAVLTIIGALNWGLVAIAEFDLVAALFADGFGTTSIASRIVYGLVGLAGVVLAFGLATTGAPARQTAHTNA